MEQFGAQQLKQLLRAASNGDEARLIQVTQLPEVQSPAPPAKVLTVVCACQLLADGVDVEAVSADGDTALTLAVEAGHDSVAQVILATHSMVQILHPRPRESAYRGLHLF